MATARGEQEPFHRPCLQQSQKRTHRQPQLRIRRQRHQSPFRAVFVVLAVLAVAFGSTVIESNPARGRIESFLAGRANFPRARRDCGISLISKTRSAAADESEIRALTESDAPDANEENTRDTLHGLLLAPLTVAVGTVPIPRRRRRDLPQLWRRQRRDQITPTHVCMASMMGNSRTISTSTPQTAFRVEDAAVRDPVRPGPR